MQSINRPEAEKPYDFGDMRILCMYATHGTQVPSGGDE
jgi:hypothetical protein